MNSSRKFCRAGKSRIGAEKCPNARIPYQKINKIGETAFVCRRTPIRALIAQTKLNGAQLGDWSGRLEDSWTESLESRHRGKKANERQT